MYTRNRIDDVMVKVRYIWVQDPIGSKQRLCNCYLMLLHAALKS